MTASPYTYPAGLPNPTKSTHTPRPRNWATDVTGPSTFVNRERAYSETTDLEFFFDSTQAATFYAWWKTSLAEGGYWFTATWPALYPTALTAQFLGEPVFSHVYNGAYKVSAKVQVRSYSGELFSACVDGPVWSATTVVSRTHNSIAYGAGRFVIGDQTSSTPYTAAQWSGDAGVTWNAASSVPSSGNYPISSVCYGNGIFLGYGGGEGMRSVDGDTWTRQSWGVGGPLGMFFVNDKFYAPNFASFLYTVDGINYFSGTFPASTLASQYMGYGKGIYVCAGTYGAGYSYDGLTWAVATTPEIWRVSHQGPIACAYGNGIFVGVGSTISSSTNITFYSRDGKTWQAGAMPIGRNWRDVIFAQGVFIACSVSDANLAISADGINWTTTSGVHSFTDSGGFERLAYDGNGNYVAMRAGLNTLANLGRC